MKKVFFGIEVLFLSLLWCSTVLGADYSEVFHSGVIDWSRGVAVSVGTALLNSRDGKSEKAKTAAANEALQSARANLLDLVGKIKMDSSTTVKDRMLQSESLGNRIRDLLEKIPPKGVQFSSNGRVEATVSIVLNGALSEVVLPQGVYETDSVQPHAPNDASKEESFTGLVVDCRGVRLRPAMSPTIFDEAGQVVYGMSCVRREHAVKRRMAAYNTEMAAAERDARVAPRPLVVRGIRAASSGPSDIVISNSDAVKIKGSAHPLRLLQSCKVVIVLE